MILAPRDRGQRLDRRERAGVSGSLPCRRSLGPRPPVRRRDQHGQAAVELALVLPFLAVLLLVLVQVGLVVRDQILVVHAAREAAREAAVDPSPDAARAAASESSSLDAGRLTVSISGRGGPGSRVRATATYGPPAQAPLVGEVVHGLRLQASATMRVEG